MDDEVEVERSTVNQNSVKEARDHHVSQVSSCSHLMEAKRVDRVEMQSNRYQTYLQIQEAVCKLKESLTQINQQLNNNYNSLRRAKKRVERAGAKKDLRNPLQRLNSHKCHHQRTFKHSILQICQFLKKCLKI